MASNTEARERITLVLRSALRPAAMPPAPSGARALVETLRKQSAHRADADSRVVAQLEVIRRFAAAYNLTLRQSTGATAHVTLEGAAADVSRAFGASSVDHRGGSDSTKADRARELPIPAALLSVVSGIVGSHEAPASISRLRVTRSADGRAVGGMRSGVKPAETPQPLQDALPPVAAALPAPAAPAPASFAATVAAPVSIDRLASHYNLPRELDGSGQRIAVISLGGGFHQSDLDEYFAEIGVAVPNVRVVSVDGAQNAPLAMETLAKVIAAYNAPGVTLGQLWQEFSHDLSDAVLTVEATMDIQIAGAVAPGAAIDVYFAPNSPQGLYHALLTAIGEEAPDGAPAATPPAVISLSWGWAEGALSSDGAELINQALERAWHRGTCICCASGDSGSVGMETQDLASDDASVLYPASSPWVLACGGTQLEVSDTGLGAEAAWNDVDRGSQQASGGGVSGAFARPAWQAAAPVPARSALNGAAWIAPSVPPTQRSAFVGRGVPDVSAYAAQAPGYRLRVGGQLCGAGGTSAATPFWAGLVARLAERVGTSVRYLPSLIYTPEFASALRPVGRGDNAIRGATSAASFSAGTGWSGCCGLGTPDGDRLLALLEAHALEDTPT